MEAGPFPGARVSDGGERLRLLRNRGRDGGSPVRARRGGRLVDAGVLRCAGRSELGILRSQVGLCPQALVEVSCGVPFGFFCFLF